MLVVVLYMSTKCRPPLSRPRSGACKIEYSHSLRLTRKASLQGTIKGGIPCDSAAGGPGGGPDGCRETHGRALLRSVPAKVCPKGKASVFEGARARLCVATDEAGLQSTALVPW